MNKGAVGGAPFSFGAKAAPRRFTNMPYVQSAALRSLSYDEAAHALRATFRGSGRTYVYEHVPQEVYDALMFADSLGAFFNRHIRGRFPFHEA
jgi:KTSC domain